MPETQPNVYETCDPTYLQQLRGRVGMDVVQLARVACLSVAQVKSLEQGRDDLFYSPAIKRQAYKRTLMILGAPPPVEPLVSDDDEGAAPVVASVNESLNQIADLTTQPVDDWRLSASAGAWVRRQKLAFVALGGVVVLSGLFAVYPMEADTSMTLASAASLKIEDEPVRVPVPAPIAKPVVVAPTEAAKPASAPISAPVAVASLQSKSCAFSSDPGLAVSPAAPKKEGKFVYFVSPTDTALCVVDGNKQANTLQLKAGEGRSIYGTSPWQISGPHLAQVQIYFQGWRASLPEGAVQKIVLVEKTLQP